MKIEKACRCTLRQIRLDEDIYGGQIGSLIGQEGALILHEDRGRHFFEFHVVTHIDDDRFKDQTICGEVHAVTEGADRITVGTEYAAHVFDIIEGIPIRTDAVPDIVRWMVTHIMFEEFMDKVELIDVEND